MKREPLNSAILKSLNKIATVAKAEALAFAIDSPEREVLDVIAYEILCAANYYCHYPDLDCHCFQCNRIPQYEAHFWLSLRQYKVMQETGQAVQWKPEAVLDKEFEETFCSPDSKW